jgi:diguanylate cyclase (GGDEF)-like protein
MISVDDLKKRLLEGKRLDNEEHEKAVSEIIETYHGRVSETLLIDDTTQIPSRKSYEMTIRRDVGKAQRNKEPLSLLMIDIDHFKQFNDTHGHSTGDAVLKEVAQILKTEQSRENFDLVARYGGEEFVVILPSANLTDAQVVAERMRKAVETGTVNLKLPPVTITCGVAELKGDMKDKRGGFMKIADGDALRDAADMALYHGKLEGRNRVYVHNREMTMPTRLDKVRKELDGLWSEHERDKAILDSKEQIYSALSTHPNQTLPQLIRDEITILEKKLQAASDRIAKLEEEKRVLEKEVA